MESSNKYRYVTVRLPKKESLTICEIEAYINGNNAVLVGIEIELVIII